MLTSFCSTNVSHGQIHPALEIHRVHMPAATDLAPSLTIAWASTVAVVVPSPAWSEVLLATSRTICAPMFSNLSSSSISLATVTPSLLMRGAPNDLSRTTLRPLAERHSHRVGENVDAAQHLVARLDREFDFLGSHLSSLLNLTNCRRRGAYKPRTVCAQRAFAVARGCGADWKATAHHR
jgi:hypothetical protein